MNDTRPGWVATGQKVGQFEVIDLNPEDPRGHATRVLNPGSDGSGAGMKAAG